SNIIHFTYIIFIIIFSNNITIYNFFFFFIIIIIFIFVITIIVIISFFLLFRNITTSSNLYTDKFALFIFDRKSWNYSTFVPSFRVTWLQFIRSFCGFSTTYLFLSQSSFHFFIFGSIILKKLI